MKKLLPFLIFLGAITLVAGNAYAISVFQTLQGGTGTSSPSGILYGDNNSTTHLNTVTIGSNLTFSGGTLSATGGGSSFGEAWQLFSNKGWLAPTTTVGIIINAASSTIVGYDAINGTTTNATSTNLNVSGQLKNGSGSALALQTNGIFGAYGGSNPCTNQVALSISATGVISCTSISDAMISSTFVKTLSVSTAQGVSGSFTAGATPALSLTLGALTGVTSFNGLVVTANTGAITTGSWAATSIPVGFTDAKVVSGSCTGGTTCSGTNPLAINSFTAEFTPFTNYAVNTNATTSIISFRGGLFASSTSNFDVLNVGSTTATSLMATSTFFGNVSIRNNASSTNLFVSSLGSAATTNICALTNGLLTITGCNNGTVTAVSVATANGFAGSSGGGATPALTLTTTLTAGLVKANGTALVAAALSDFPAQNANTVIANGTGGSAVPTAVATSSLFTLGAGLTQSSTLFQQKENRGFSYATTSWSGTTTVQLGLGYGEVWNNIICKTNTGTVNVDFYHASSHFVIGNSFNASTTVGTIFNLQNQTDTAKDAVQVDLGTPASSPLNVTCTVNDTI